MPLPAGSGLTGTGSYVQPVGDPTRRVTIPRVSSWSETWTIDAALTFYEGRSYPVAARGQGVTYQWTVTLQYTYEERDAAAALVDLLRSATTGVDARLELHLEALGLTPVDAIVECHEVPLEVPDPVQSTTSLTFTRVDA